MDLDAARWADVELSKLAEEFEVLEPHHMACEVAMVAEHLLCIVAMHSLKPHTKRALKAEIDALNRISDALCGRELPEPEAS